jgi:hypothetical protein
MTPDEINEKIARDVMGWTKSKLYELESGRKLYYWLDGESMLLLHHDSGTDVDFNPLDNPLHTQMLIEKLRITRPFTVHFSPSGYSISDFDPRGEAKASGFATLGEAVCMFALGEI